MPSDIFPRSDIVTTNPEIISGEKLCQFSSFYSEVLILATLHNVCHSEDLLSITLSTVHTIWSLERSCSFVTEKWLLVH